MDIHRAKLAVRRQSIRMLTADELRIARGVRDGGHGGNTKTKPKLTTRPPGRRRRIAALTTVTRHAQPPPHNPSVSVTGGGCVLRVSDTAVRHSRWTCWVGCFH